MKPAFDINGADFVEFGVGLKEEENERFTLVPVDVSVQAILKQMAIATRDEMNGVRAEPNPYETSEKYESPEFLFVPIEEAIASRFRDLHTANNKQPEADALKDPTAVFCYFARFKFKRSDIHLTAVRRATSFKGILKAQLIRFLDNSLKLIEEQAFKLDSRL